MLTCSRRRKRWTGVNLVIVWSRVISLGSMVLPVSLVCLGIALATGYKGDYLITPFLIRCSLSLA